MSTDTKKYISIDDYNPKNYKIAGLIKQYGLEGNTIFFLHFPDLQKEDLAGEHSGSLKMCRDLHRKGFEIGSHTKTHPRLTTTPKDDVWNEIKKSRDLIISQVGKCDWFSYPYGQYNDEIIEMVKKAGYKYARTSEPTEGNFEMGALHIGWVGEIKGKAVNEFETAYKSNMNHFYLHQYDLEMYNTYKEFERFLQWFQDSV